MFEPESDAVDGIDNAGWGLSKSELKPENKDIEEGDAGWGMSKGSLED